MDPQFPDADDRLVLDADCSRCPALVDSRTCISWGNGPRDADVVVVGEAPGAGDAAADRWRGGNHTGLAYTSRHSGRRVRRLMADVGVADRTYYTNAVKCFPADGEGSNREPTAAERANCRPHLATELDRIDPTVVLPTGKHATTSVLAFEDRDVDGFLDVVLEPFDCPTLDATVVPLLHPSYRDVWQSRLGYDDAAYRRELAARLRDCGVAVD
ncbi:uracil-DNA glycosylase family protein [Haloplanus sp. GCM10025708]|uniref:uracil-DNA glycosylase n=1 Tax=Haloferacaceae TaxID=1644056 RepID=UPI0036077407